MCRVRPLPPPHGMGLPGSGVRVPAPPHGMGLVQGLGPQPSPPPMGQVWEGGRERGGVGLPLPPCGWNGGVGGLRKLAQLGLTCPQIGLTWSHSLNLGAYKTL